MRLLVAPVAPSGAACTGWGWGRAGLAAVSSLWLAFRSWMWNWSPTGRRVECIYLLHPLHPFDSSF